MVSGDLWHEIHYRFKLQETKKSIARTLKIGVSDSPQDTLRQENPVSYQPRLKMPSIIAAYEDYIRQLLAAVGYCTQSIFEELRKRVYRQLRLGKKIYPISAGRSSGGGNISL